MTASRSFVIVVAVATVVLIALVHEVDSIRARTATKQSVSARFCLLAAAILGRQVFTIKEGIGSAQHFADGLSERKLRVYFSGTIPQRERTLAVAEQTLSTLNCGTS